MPQAGPGDIVAVAKLASTQTGDTLVADRAAGRQPAAARRSRRRRLQVSIEPESKADLDKLGQALSAHARGGAVRAASIARRAPARRS